MKALIARFIGEESGQDLIEYALLSAFIGLAGFAAFQWLATGIASAYSSWDGANQGLWEPDDPL